MKSTVHFALVILLTLDATVARSDSASEILDAAWDAQEDRWEGLDSYRVDQSVMDRDMQQYFVRDLVTDVDGNQRDMFLPSPDATPTSACVDTSSLSGATAYGNDADPLTWFMDSAELIGEESIDGNAAWQLRANDIAQTRAMNGQEVIMKSMSMWLSKEDYVPLRIQMHGEATVDGQTRPVIIETQHSDFRNVPGSGLREPFRRVMTISGMTAGLDMDHVLEAQAKLQEMETKMAAMPAAQRKMMEKMMGSQLNQIRVMAESGAIKTEILVKSITPNPEIDGVRVVACDNS